MSNKKWLQGKFNIKNNEKYVGTNTPTYRSSWEFAFMQFCDNHPNIINWASEAIKIPYRNPLTGKQSIYVPDFLVVYQDKDGNQRTELVEIKPSSQTTLESAGKSKRNVAAVAVNMAKWQAANAWARRAGVTFKVISEADIFKNTKNSTKRR
jgi:hypothetical protein